MIDRRADQGGIVAGSDVSEVSEALLRQRGSSESNTTAAAGSGAGCSTVSSQKFNTNDAVAPGTERTMNSVSPTIDTCCCAAESVSTRCSRRTRSSSVYIANREPVRLVLGEGEVEHGGAERGRVGRIGHGSGPVGARELALAALADGLDEVGVAVVDEVRERRSLAVLLAHEQHRRERRQQDRRGGEPVTRIVDRRVREQAGAGGRVADVVVVGVEDDEASVVDVVGRRTVAAVEARRVLARVDPAAVPRRGEIADPRVARVVLVALAGERHSEGMMDVVVPHGVAAPAVVGLAAHDARIVGRALDRHQCRPAGRLRSFMDGRRQLLDEGDRGRIDDGVHGVEPEPVEVEVADPSDGVLDEVPPDMIAAGTRDVHRVAPWRAVGVGEVRPVPPEHVALRSHVVVHHVEHDTEPEPVRGVDEPSERVGTAVGVLDCEREDPVVAPVASTRERGDRHHLDRGDAQLVQSGQVTDRRVEGAFRGERADVQLVEHRVGELDADPGVVVPPEQ